VERKPHLRQKARSSLLKVHTGRKNKYKVLPISTMSTDPQQEGSIQGPTELWIILLTDRSPPAIRKNIFL